MSDKPLIPLLPISISLDNPVFRQEICQWQFADSFVSRLLQNDIPQRVKFGNARIWIYRDPNNEIVGFGTIDVCQDYAHSTGGKPHPYIPLLAVNPKTEGRGHGNSTVKHLIGEAVLLANQPGGGCHDLLFLEVYTANIRAISLYQKHGFVKLTDQPVFDPAERQDYFIMARRVSIAPD